MHVLVFIDYIFLFHNATSSHAKCLKWSEEKRMLIKLKIIQAIILNS